MVAIAAGGGRALSLLIPGPRRLVALDRRDDQICHLELKAASMEALGYREWTGFLGLRESGDRRDVYATLRPALTPAARRYWDARARLVEEGVLYAGRTERALSGYARRLRQLRLFHWPERYFGAETLADQKRMLAEDAARLRRAERYWRLFVNPPLFFAVTQDPSFLRSSHGSLGRYLYGRFLAWARRHRVRDSFFLHLIFFGRFPPEGPLPPHLEPAGFEAARKHLDHLELRCARIEDYAPRLRSHARVKWSLSDVSAWMPERRFHELLRVLSQVGASGSRLCARNFAVERSIPLDLCPRVRRLDDLCARLDDEDRAVFYRFEVAEYGPA